jgi:hypothetical protein
MSGLSCSDARRPFFIARATANQKLRQVRRIDFDVLGRKKHVCQLRHGDIGSLCDNTKDKLPMQLQLAVPETTTRLGRNTARVLPALQNVQALEAAVLKRSAA